jgi:hypothetical protein
MKLIHSYSGGAEREQFWLPDADELARLVEGAAVRTRLDADLQVLIDVLDADQRSGDDDDDDDDDRRPSAAELGAFDT